MAQPSERDDDDHVCAVGIQLHFHTPLCTYKTRGAPAKLTPGHTARDFTPAGVVRRSIAMSKDAAGAAERASQPAQRDPYPSPDQRGGDRLQGPTGRTRARDRVLAYCSRLRRGRRRGLSGVYYSCRVHYTAAAE